MADTRSSEFADELRAVVQDISSRGDAGDVWPTLVELGLAGVGVDEDAGGSGGDLVDLVTLVGELAAAGVSSPIIEASVGAWTTGRPAGDRIASPVDAGDVSVVDGRVTGEVLVRWPEVSETLVLLTRDGIATVALEGPNVSTSPWPTVGAPMGLVRLTGAAASPLPAPPTSDQVRERLAILRSAASVGAGRAAVARTIDYALAREQFGAPLAAIPAVVSAIGMMRAQLDLADAALAGALREDAPRGAAMAARLSAAAMATAVARTAHQLHGAMGVAQEYPLHPLTTALWDLRDADEREAQIARRLGAAARAGGESAVWEHLSA